MPVVTVEHLEKLESADLADLCDATETAILDGGGFGWLAPPPREVLERYWQGVLLVPERELFVGRLDGTIAGSAELVRPARNNEAQAHAAQITTNFVAPWARGHGMARAITLAVEAAARAGGFHLLRLDVRATQEAAIRLYESLGYRRWGESQDYAMVKGEIIAGLYYSKRLRRPRRGRTKPGAGK